jgi:predicted acylesterase/phospholipase RssA
MVWQSFCATSRRSGSANGFLRSTARCTSAITTRLSSALALIMVLSVALTAVGCAALTPRNALPQAAAAQVEPDGFHDIRYWGDEASPDIASFRPTRRGLAAEPRGPSARGLNFLAISGGAEDGAFGAGLLAGWGEAGNRPMFDLVTGVSSGALVAPFVFLGRERDSQLREIFTSYGRKDIYAYDVQNLVQGSALVDDAPLSNLIAKYVDRDFLRDIARESRKGRVLLIGTTDLDAQRPVLWDMGRIAENDSLSALELFRKVLLASATLPGVFAPVRIKVRVGGKDYDELHVDGGVTRQVFISPSIMRLVSDHASRRTVKGARLYVVRNGRIDPRWEPVNDDVLSVTQRSLSTLIKNQGIGDLYRIYSIAKLDGIDFNLASIPTDFDFQTNAPFDLKYMQALFARGYDMGKSGFPWVKNPPGLQTADQLSPVRRQF